MKAMKTTIKMLILLIAASIAYSLQSFTCIKISIQQDSSMFKTREGEIRYLESYNNALKLWPVKFEEVDIKTGFGKAHVIISGPESGNPLVLLHGMNASSTMWYPNVKDLSKTHRLYAIDFIEEPGKSLMQKKIKSNDDIVSWYTEIFEKLHLKKFSIIGESRGGWLAVQLALHSTEIKKVVLLSPAQTLIMVKPKRKILQNAFFSLFPERTRFRRTLKTLSYNVDHLEKAWTDQYFNCLQDMKKQTDVMKMDVYSDKELESLNIPVLLLIGDHDIFNNERSIERAKKLIPGVDTYIVKKCGHFISFDQPEFVDQKISEFLSKN